MSFTLYLMRHAKSDWSSSELSDFDRPINSRGQKSAQAIGRWLAEHNKIPQYIISSSAIRAKQTTALMVVALTDVTPENILYEERLYLASVETLLKYIKINKTGLNSLMLVGHNPGMEELADYLLAKSAQPNNGITSMTTANVAIFEYADDEFDIYNDHAKLLDFIRPGEII